MGFVSALNFTTLYGKTNEVIYIPSEISAYETCEQLHKPFIFKPSNINPVINGRPTNPPPSCDYCNLLDAIRNGKMLWWFRARNEDIHEKGLKDGYANTIASHLGYQTAGYYHFSGLLEFTDTTIIGRQLYNSGGGTSPGLRKYAITNDPRGARIQQAFIEYNDFFKTDLKGGRQRIRLDNERFIGDSGWRQMEQVYDGISLFNTAIPNLNLFYAYIGRVNRVWGPKGVGIFGDNANHTHVVNIRYDILDLGSIIGYEYFIDNAKVRNFSTSTLGLRFNGSKRYQNLNFLYTAEYANQANAANNPVHYRAQYSHFAGGMQIDTNPMDMEFDLQREDLGGQRHKIGGAFITPLASFHGFQGWAELFNVTPNRGVTDWVASASFKIKPLSDITFLTYYHHFRSSATSRHRFFGYEFDAEVGKEFKYVGLYLDYAKFISKNRTFIPTQRIWVIIKTLPFM